MRAVLASPAMPRAAAVAVGGLAFAALFLSDGSSQSRLFWIGAAAVVAAAVGWAIRPPALSVPALVFFGLFAAFVAWEGASIAWSIQPGNSWDYANRGLVYLAFAAAGALLGGVAPRRLAYATAALLAALFVLALAAKVIAGLDSDYERLARLRYPVGYWNELALLAAMSVPVGLWLLRRARLAGALLLYVSHSVRLEDGLLFGAALVVGAVVVWAALRYVVTRAVDERVVRAVALLLAAL